jgi:hypothetical protein
LRNTAASIAIALSLVPLDWRKIKPASTARKDAARRSTIPAARATPSGIVALFSAGSKRMIRGTVGIVWASFGRAGAIAPWHRGSRGRAADFGGSRVLPCSADLISRSGELFPCFLVRELPRQVIDREGYLDAGPSQIRGFTRLFPVGQGKADPSAGVDLDVIGNLVAVHRLREVSCLYGFTRFEAAPTAADGEIEDVQLAVRGVPISRDADWLPAIEQFGQGIFVHFDEEAIGRWLQNAATSQRNEKLLAGYGHWQKRFGGKAPPYPGTPYVVLHALRAEIEDARQDHSGRA